MTTTADDVTRAVNQATIECLDACLARISHCVEQLNEEQVWWRPRPAMNSIGNLMLHLCGNMRQWVIAGIGGAGDIRNRPAEFTELGPIPKQELLQRLRAVVEQSQAVLERASSQDMLATRRIQGSERTGWQAVLDCVPHFQGHVQEIIAMTRLQLGDAYRFRWSPVTREEGAGDGQQA